MIKSRLFTNPALTADYGSAVAKVNECAEVRSTAKMLRVPYYFAPWLHFERKPFRTAAHEGNLFSSCAWQV